MTETKHLKNLLRQEYRQKRKELSEQKTLLAAALITARFLESIPLTSGTIVGGFWPLKGEPDVCPLLAGLLGRGYECSLPVVMPDSRLIYKRWRPGDPLEVSSFATQQPLPTAENLDPNIMLVPLVAFDATGARLGQGGGHYDRALTARKDKLDFISVGIAYDFQRCDAVPREEHDVCLNYIVTEERLYKIT